MPFLHSKIQCSDVSDAGYSQNSNLFFRIYRKDNDREHSKYNLKINSEKSLKSVKPQKRHVFPFFKIKAEKKYSNPAASLTVEAAIVLPLMIMALYMLIYPLKLIDAERRLQNTMEAVAKELSQAEYVNKLGSRLIKNDKKDIAASVVNGLEKGAGIAAVLSAVDYDRFCGAAFSEDTSILSQDADADPSMIYMKLEYNVKSPVPVFDFFMKKKSIVTNRRAWTGSDGGRGRNKYSDCEDDENSDNPDKIVYLGKTSSEVYHLDPNCHYLSNKLNSADAKDMDNLRNSYGSKYHACTSCKPGRNGRVYYSEAGSAYHGSEQCKAIIAYSRCEKLSELKGMRPCSYCGKNKNKE